MVWGGEDHFDGIEKEGDSKAVSPSRAWKDQVRATTNVAMRVDPPGRGSMEAHTGNLRHGPKSAMKNNVDGSVVDEGDF